MSKSKESHVFEKEIEIVAYSKRVLAKKVDEVSHQELFDEYVKLAEQYELLLKETKLLTSVSDRLQNKLNRANDQIKEQNQQLRETIDMLLKARIGRKATTMVLILAVVLFILSEGLIEPQIELIVDNDFIVGLTLKGFIAVLLKPLEVVTEKMMLRKAVQERHDDLGMNNE